MVSRKSTGISGASSRSMCSSTTHSAWKLAVTQGWLGEVLELARPTALGRDLVSPSGEFRAITGPLRFRTALDLIHRTVDVPPGPPDTPFLHRRRSIGIDVRASRCVHRMFASLRRTSVGTAQTDRVPGAAINKPCPAGGHVLPKSQRHSARSGSRRQRGGLGTVHESIPAGRSRTTTGGGRRRGDPRARPPGCQVTRYCACPRRCR